MTYGHAIGCATFWILNSYLHTVVCKSVTKKFHMTPAPHGRMVSVSKKKRFFLNKKGRGIEGLKGLLLGFPIKGILRGIWREDSTLGEQSLKPKIEEES